MNLCKRLNVFRSAHCFWTRFISTPLKDIDVSNIVIEPLKNREIIRTKGTDLVQFLQGLVTNDVAQLGVPNAPNAIYAMFLNKGGRVLYDTVIYRTNNPEVLYIECDASAAPELCGHLRSYRVRRKIDIDSIKDEYTPWVIYDDGKNLNREDVPQSQELIIAPDPRLSVLGTRIIAPSSTSWSNLVNTFSCYENIKYPTAKNNYRTLRYKHGVGEGVNELPTGKCLPLEANGDYLKAISFNKGCYIGQELTARVHHSGVVRKRYMPVRLTGKPKIPSVVQSKSGGNLGTIFSLSNERGIALLRINEALNAEEKLAVDGVPCYAEKPSWWPNQKAN